MFETPDLSHMTSADTDHVYDAAEDTFLMLDALQKDYESIKLSRYCNCNNSFEVMQQDICAMIEMPAFQGRY